VADPYAAKSPSGATPLASNGEGILSSLPVDIADLPADVRERLVARAHARGGRLHIGRYVITGELGRGGMGVVYDAWDPRIDRRVAVKTIEPDLIPDEGEREEVIERFRREIKMVGKLHHPSIVTLFDYGEEPELRKGDDPYAAGRIYYYVMEYLEGRSLAKTLREKKQLPDLEAVQIALDVADALRVAHARGIIHRDIKPSNILIRGHRAVLLDFGIAKTNQAALTRQGQILGTPTYLAPERLREKEDGLDGRADIFSLGVLLYTMLVGEAPFQGDNVYDLLDNIAKQVHLKLPRTTQGGVVLSRALDRMLAKRPQDRYASADEVVTALEQAKALLQTTTPDVSDLGAGLVLVTEPMTDAATEVATPSQPLNTAAMMPSIAKPGDVLGTAPEVALGRSTRRIEVELDDGPGTTPSVWDADSSSEIVSVDSIEINGVDDDMDSADTAGATVPGNRKAGHNGGGVTLKQSTSMQLEAVRLPKPPAQVASPPIPAISTHELRAPQRRMVSLAGEEETLAEANRDRHEAKTASEVNLKAPDTADIPPQRGATVGGRSRRPRIEASLVDEDDVVVRPAPLDSLHPDEVPTQSGVPTPGSGIAMPVARPGDPVETDIVRPRRIGPPARDPAEQRNAANAARREQYDVVERPTNSAPPPPPSAAIARRTVAARGVSGRREAPPVDDIRVTGTDLDRPGARARAVRMRVMVLVLLALVSIAVGLMLGRRKDAREAQPTAAVSAEPAAPAPAPKAMVGEAPRPLEGAGEAVSPRSPAEIIADAQRAYLESRLSEADRLFARALESATEGSEVQARALVGRARVLAAQGENDRAEKLLRRVVDTRTDGPELREAKALLEASGKDSAPVRRTAAPRPQPAASASASPAPSSAAPRPTASATPPPTPTPTPVANNENIADLSIDEQCRLLIRRHLNDPQAGIAALESLALRAPSAACVHKQLGTFYRRVGNDRSAITAYQRYLQLEPNAPDKASVQSRIDSISARLPP